MPVHPFLEGQEFRQRGTRDHHQGHVMVAQMQIGSVKMIGKEGTAVTAFFPAGTEHEVIDDHLTATVKQIAERLFAGGRVEFILLVDLDPRQCTAFFTQTVPRTHMVFFTFQVRLAGFEPFCAGDDLGTGHIGSPFPSGSSGECFPCAGRRRD